MDLLDLSHCKLYFDTPLPAEAERLLIQASQEHNLDSMELALLRAHLLAPENLGILVKLYGCYFRQHRHPEALRAAELAMALAGRQLGLPPEWEGLDAARLGRAARHSFGLLRFYLLAMKAVSLVLLRVGSTQSCRQRLAKLAELDSHGHLGAARLLQVVDEFQAPPVRPESPIYQAPL